MTRSTASRSEAYVTWVLNHRKAVGTITVLITVVALGILSQATLSTSVLELFFGENPTFQSYKARAAVFGESERCSLAVEMKDLLQPQAWSRIAAITDGLQALDEVADVESLTTVNAIWSDGDDLHIETYAPLWEGDALGPFTAKEQALQDPLVMDTLASLNGPTVLFVVEFVPNVAETAEIMPVVYEKLLAVFKKEGIKSESVYAAGLLPESVETNHQTKRTLLLLFPATILILLAAVYLLFGQLWPVLITGGVASLAVIWTFALAITLDPRVNLLMAMVPALMMVITFADVIHLCSAYIIHRRKGSDKTQALIRSASAVGEACFYTSITTLLGFAALTFVPTPALQQLGVILGAGVAIALLLAVTLTPMALHFLPDPRQSDSVTPLGMRLVATIVQTCRHLAKSYPWLIIAIAIVLCALSLGPVGTTPVEASLSQRLAKGNPIRQSHQFINERFGGAYFLDYYIEAEGDSVLTPDTYAALTRLTRLMEAHPSIHRAFSVVDVIAPLHQAINPAANELPNTAELLSQYLLLFEAAGGDEIDTFLDPERQTARILVQSSHQGFVAASQTAHSLLLEGQELLPAGHSMEVTGLIYLLGDWVQELFQGCLDGLLFAFLTTCFMLTVSMRLGFAGLVAMIPNAVPIILMIGVLCWVFDHFDPEAMFVGMIAVGIAVDDTIHFITCLRQNLNQPRTSPEKAVHQAFEYAGAAIVKTTLILCAGFLPFAFSDYMTTRFLGILLPATLVAALFADLLLLPALVYTGILRVGPSQKRNQAK